MSHGTSSPRAMTSTSGSSPSARTGASPGASSSVVVVCGVVTAGVSSVSAAGVPGLPVSEPHAANANAAAQARARSARSRDMAVPR